MGGRNNRIECVNADCRSLDVIVVETRYMVCGSRVRRRRCECCGERWHTVQPPEQQIETWRLSWPRRGPVALLPPAVESGDCAPPPPDSMPDTNTPNLPLSSLGRHSRGALMAAAGALACVLGTPAQAADQYCTRANPGFCTLNNGVGFVGNIDTYFWSPTLQPAPTFLLSSFAGRVKKLTLRGSSDVTINASGSSTQAEVLIGSLGTNTLQGGNSPGVGTDTFVVGNPPATVNCQASGVGCTVSGVHGAENDRVILSSLGASIIYIDRCLQVTAPNAFGQPGKGGGRIVGAAKASPMDANFAPIVDMTGVCPVASIAAGALQATALHGRDALLAPWERFAAPLQQAAANVLRGPGANAATQQYNPQAPAYKGVTRVVQKDPKGNFLRAGGDHGSTIVVDAGSLRFNQQALQPSRANSTVHKQTGGEAVPLNQGIALVYHEPIGVLASYSNDRHSYGSKHNPGSVIAQLTLGDGTVLPARSIDHVLLGNLHLPEGQATSKLAAVATPFSISPWALLLLPLALPGALAAGRIDGKRRSIENQ